MPNIVTNIMTVAGDAQRVQACLAAIASDESPIDFNRLIPMPADLEIKWDTLILFLDGLFDGRTSPEEIKDAITQANDAELRNFCQALCNLNAHGHTTWHSWRNAHWGTKWNAFEAKREGNTVKFETAWYPPVPFLRTLGERYPDLTFTVEYADEDIGFNCGTIVVHGREFTDTPTAPEDTVSFGLRVTGMDAAEYYRWELP